MPDMPERVGARRREPGMLKTAAMASLGSAERCKLSCRSLPMLVPPVVLLQQYDMLLSQHACLFCMLAWLAEGAGLPS